MNYFPAFIKLDNKKVLIIGGGNIATSKLKTLLDFTTDIHIIAPILSDEIQILIKEYNLTYSNTEYKDNDLELFNFVITAIDNIKLQEKIYNEAKLLPNCLVNSVDSTEYCDFIFPSYIKKDDLTIAISTSGTSPSMAKYLKQYLQNIIPNSIGNFLKEMKEYRQTMPKGKERMKFLDTKTKEYISTWGEIK